MPSDDLERRCDPPRVRARENERTWHRNAIWRGPTPTVYLLLTFFSLTFVLASHAGFLCQVGVVPDRWHAVVTPIIGTIFLGYLVPISFLRPTVLWTRYPDHPLFLGGIFVLPMLVILFLMAYPLV